MFNKILVAVDRSASHTVVFAQALSLAKATGATLMLLHVLSEKEPGSPVRIISADRDPLINNTVEELYQQQWKAFEQEGLELLRSLGEQATASGVKAAIAQLYGHPSHQICALAQDWSADLVVVGRRGHSGLKELLLGSVSNYVIHHARCTVLVIQAPAPLASGSEPETSALTSTES